MSRRVKGSWSRDTSVGLVLALQWILRHVAPLLGALIVLAVAAGAVLAPRIAPMDPITQDLASRLEPPSWLAQGQSRYVLGSDGFGRDILSRILFGGRVSLAVVVAGIIVSGFFGTVLGLMAGYYEGPLAMVVMRLADTQLAFPPILLAVVVVAIFGTSLVNLIIILAISAWVTYARIVYGLVLSVKHMEYVLAARSIGASDFRIMSTHILRNSFGALIVVATLQVGRMILFEAGLSFLGMGVPVPAPSWGSMLSEGRNVLAVAPWLATFPGLAIVVTVLGINLLGDGLRELLDPKLRIG
jgi:peptide/nickel transport system permease protein